MAAILPAQQWTFTQMGAPNPVTLQLTGWSMPFGRPRQGTIVNGGIKIGYSVARPPGNHVEPVINSFGDQQPPWTMHGRWMDQAIGSPGSAKATARAWKDAIGQQFPFLVNWQNMLAYRIFIHELELNWESQAECAWVLHAEALSDLSDVPPTPMAPVQTPSDQATQMQQLYPSATFAQSSWVGDLSRILGLLPDIADAMTLATAAILIPFQVVQSISSAITDFASATSTDLAKLAGGLSAVATLLGVQQQNTDLLCSRAALLQQQYEYGIGGYQGGALFAASDVSALMATKLQSDGDLAALLAVMAAMLAEVNAFRQGTGTPVTVMANPGDTWESIAAAQLGSVDGAQALKDQNGIRFGAQPIPGRIYQIPSTT